MGVACCVFSVDFSGIAMGFRCCGICRDSRQKKSLIIKTTNPGEITMQDLKNDFLEFKSTFIAAREAINEKLKGTKITAEQWIVLDSITPGIHCTELAELSGLLVPSLSRMIKQLEEDGLIMVTDSFDDRRNKKISLRVKGRNLLDKIKKRAAS